MLTLIMVATFIALSCTAAAGLIASAQNSADADRSTAGLTIDGGEGNSLVVSDGD